MGRATPTKIAADHACGVCRALLAGMLFLAWLAGPECVSGKPGPEPARAAPYKVVFLTVKSHFQGRPSEKDAVHITFRNRKTGMLYGANMQDGAVTVRLADGDYEIKSLSVWHATEAFGGGWEHTYEIRKALSPRMQPLAFTVGGWSPALYLGSLSLNLYRPMDLENPVSAELRKEPVSFRIMIQNAFVRDRRVFEKRFPVLKKRYPELTYDYALTDTSLPQAQYLFHW